MAATCDPSGSEVYWPSPRTGRQVDTDPTETQPVELSYVKQPAHWTGVSKLGLLMVIEEATAEAQMVRTAVRSIKERMNPPWCNITSRNVTSFRYSTFSKYLEIHPFFACALLAADGRFKRHRA